MSEVAINPKEIFLQDSNNKSLSEQKSLIIKYEKDVKKNVNDIKVIMGKTPDNVALAKFITSESNGNENPFAGKSVRCAEPSPISNSYSGSFGVTVGRMNDEGQLLITGRDSRRAKQDVYVIPIVVPEDLPVPVEEPVHGKEPAK